MTGRRKELPESIDEARWQAIERRDPAADGRFLYGVATTGVYCRPSCKSRRPRRENVVFFANAREAERAGFRACRRCKPDAAGGIDAPLGKAVRAACAAIASAEEPPSLAALAAGARLSAGRFQRAFKAATGVTPKQYAMAIREERARGMIRAGRPIGEAIYAAGFGAGSRFYESAARTLGMRPKALRAGGAGERICVAIERTSLGFLLVAATARGICLIALGDSRGELMRECQGRFPGARIERGDAAFAGWVRAILDSIREPRRKLDLPLDIRGTAFQRRVWQELQRIPPGTTATYRQLAAKAGRPRAVRAAGSACGANPAALAIPCHRAVRADGGLGGYRWGIERKRKLLAAERDAAKGKKEEQGDEKGGNALLLDKAPRK